MSSPILEDGEIISEEPNEIQQANDKFVLQKTVNTMRRNVSGGVGAGVIVATVSISMEQSREMGYEAQNCVETVDVDGNVTATKATLSMSRTQTRKITAAYSSAVCPLDSDTMVTFGDQQIAKVANERSIGVNGNMKRNKRKLVSKKNAAIHPPKKRSPNKTCPSLKGNRFSVLTSDSQTDDFIDEDEMLCVRGASPQHKQLSSYPPPQILTTLRSSDSNMNKKLKPLKKAKTKKCSSKRAGNSSKCKKPKKKLNIDGKKTTNKTKSSGLKGEEDDGFAKSPVEVSTLLPNEHAQEDNTMLEVTNNNETLQELRQKLCFLTEQQIDSLLQLNVHCPEQALHLTLWQLNSIGINKATQLEAMLSTLLNGHDVDMRKLLPQPSAPIDQNVSNVSHVCNKALVEEAEEEEYEDHPLVIDETHPINVNEEEDANASNTEALLNTSIAPLKLDVHVDENEIRQATKQIAERIQIIKTSNVECTVKKQELLNILDKLNELEKQEQILKITKNEKQQDPIKQDAKENEILLKALSKDITQTTEESQTESLAINAVTDEEKISALNLQDKNKDQSDTEESTKIAAEQLELDLNPFSMSDRKITQNEVLTQTMLKLEENSEKTLAEKPSLVEKPSLALDGENTNTNTVDDITEKTVDKDDSKPVTNKSLTATPESAKMTLRSRRKIITTKVDIKLPCEQVYLPQPKVVITNMKPRRLKISKRSPTTEEPNNTKEVLDNTHLANDSNITIQIQPSDSKETVTPEKRPLLVYLDTPKRSNPPNWSTLNTSTPNSTTEADASLFIISTPTANTTQYTDDWEACIDGTRIITQLKASPVNSQAKIKYVKYLKSNEDLRFKIEEKKKIKENEARSALLSSSPTKMATGGTPTNILAVEKDDILQQIKEIHNEKYSEEQETIMEKNSEDQNNNENEKKETEENTDANNAVKQNPCSDNLTIKPSCDNVKPETEETSEIDAFEIVEKTIAIKCAEEQQNNYEKILEQTTGIVAKNVTDQKRNIENSYDNKKNYVDNITIEQNSPIRAEKQLAAYTDKFSDEENWDNVDTCSVDPRTKGDTYKVEQKSYNDDKYSPKKRRNTNDYNDNSNNNSYGCNNFIKKNKLKFNPNHRGSNNAFKYGEGQINKADNYNTGRQANNADNYNGRQANNADNYKGRQANNADNYKGRQANNADNYNYNKRQANNADNYNGRQANNADNYNGRQANNTTKYTVEQRCSEDRGPYQVKYDSEEDWDNEESKNTSTKNTSAKNNNSKNSNNFSKSYSNSNNSSNKNFSNSYNSNSSNYNSNNYSNNAPSSINASSTSSSSSFDNKASVIESPRKEYNTEKPLSKNPQSNSQQESSSSKSSQMGKLEVNTNDWEIDSSTALSPQCPEIASPTYPSVNNLCDYTPAIEIDAHMSFPPMPYSLREIKLANIEVNKPESLDKLLRSNTVDPRLLKYKDKGFMDISSAPPMLSYFSSKQISQYDPRRRTSVMHTSTALKMDCCSPMQPQNANVLLYRYLQRSAWYQSLMSTMKMQINHSIAELVRALNNFQKERLIDASAIFDVFKIDCAGELLEIMRNIGICIDANGFISENKGFGQYGQHAVLNSPAPINATYSFMPQLLPAPVKQGMLSYSPSVSQHSSCPVVLPPQMQAASFVSCYVDAPTLTPMTPRRSCAYNVHNMNSCSPPPTPFDDMHEQHASSSDVAYYGNINKHNFDMDDERRTDRPALRGDGGGFNGNRHKGRQRY